MNILNFLLRKYLVNRPSPFDCLGPPLQCLYISIPQTTAYKSLGHISCKGFWERLLTDGIICEGSVWPEKGSVSKQASCTASNSSSMYCFFMVINQASNRYNKSNSFKYIWNKARGGLIIGCIFRLLVNGPLNRGAYELSIGFCGVRNAGKFPTSSPTHPSTHPLTYLPTNHIHTHLHCMSPVITG